MGFRNNQSGLGTAIETSLQDLTTRHADLVEDREEVLIDRQRIASSAFNIRKLRDLVKDAEVRLMNVFRRTAYNNLEKDLSDQVAVTYAEVEKLRDDLVDAEDKHAELVQNLELSEWALTKKEEDLYQRDIPRLIYPEDSASTGTNSQVMVQEENLEATTTFSSPDMQHHIALENYRHAVRQFRELSRADDDQTKEHSQTSSNFETSYIGQSTKSGTGWGASEVLDNMVHCEIDVIQTRKELTRKTLGSFDIQTHSEPSLTAYFQLERHSGKTFRNTQSEVAGYCANDALPSSSRVNEWLLDCLQRNVNHKLHFVTMLQEILPLMDGCFLEYEQWEERIMRYWTFDASGLSAIQSTRLSERCSSTTPADSSTSHEDSVGIEFGMMFPESRGYEPSSASHFHRALKIPHFQIDSPSSVDSSHTASKHQFRGSRLLDRVPLNPEYGPPPEVRVTAPDDESDLTPEIAPAMNQLSASKDHVSRCDSAHSSEVEESQHARVQQVASVEDDEFLGYGSIPAVVIVNHEAGMADSGWLIGDNQEVRHTPWTWSPDLALYFTHRFGDDDEVIEAIWLQFSDLKERTHTEDKISREASKGKM
jgi:rubrerythrin